jgi:hypothetical protein
MDLWNGGMMEWWSIAKYQIPIFNDQNKKQVWNLEFGYCDLFDI